MPRLPGSLNSEEAMTNADKAAQDRVYIELEESLAKAEKEIKKLKAKAEAPPVIDDTAMKRAEELEQQVVAKDEKLQTLDQQLVSKSMKLHELYREVAARDERIQELEETVAREQGNGASIRGEVDAVRASLNQARQAVAKVADEKSALAKVHLAELERVRQDLKTVENEAAEMREEIIEQKVELQRLREAVAQRER